MQPHVHAIGGRTHGVIQRKNAIDRYYANPNFCLSCKRIIEVLPHRKVTHTKRKKFCDVHCASDFNKPGQRMKIDRKPNPCKNCGADTGGRVKKLCRTCSEKYWSRVPKKPKSKATHSEIRQHARYIARSKPRICEKCSYSKYVEVCHIVPVREFPPSSLLEEINLISNLVVLCPNCHWELDHP